MALDEAVFVGTFVFGLFSPVFADQELLKIRLIRKVIFYLPSVVVLDLEVREAYGKHNIAASDRVQ